MLDEINPQSAVEATQFMKVDELARLLNVSSRTVWRKLSAGEIIKPIRLGKIIRWSRREVDLWVSLGCSKPTN